MHDGQDQRWLQASEAAEAQILSTRNALQSDLAEGHLEWLSRGLAMLLSGAGDWHQVGALGALQDRNREGADSEDLPTPPHKFPLASQTDVCQTPAARSSGCLGLEANTARLRGCIFVEKAPQLCSESNTDNLAGRQRQEVVSVQHDTRGPGLLHDIEPRAGTPAVLSYKDF